MKQVTDKLKEIELKRNVKILYACETGSRAWGFPSPDSDYDVRFIYIHERDWYLSLSQRKDTIEHMDGEMDITGWDLRKCLLLLRRSNATLIERFQSPMEYYSVDGFKNEFKELIEKYYSPTAVYFHHYSLAKKFLEEIKDAKEYKLKSWFYMVRSLFSCSWILEKDTVLPMNIQDLMSWMGEYWRRQVNELIELKKTVGEKYLHPYDKQLNDRIFELFEMMEKSEDNLKVNRLNMSYLDKFFLDKLDQHADNRTNKK